MDTPIEIIPFTNSEFGTIRTVEQDGKVLFCGKDVATALGYSNPRKALIDHCKGVTKRDTPTSSGIQSMSFITEGDLYRLIASSKLPSAQKFESWVFDEVLPSIRKQGAYVYSDGTESDDVLMARGLSTTSSISFPDLAARRDGSAVIVLASPASSPLLLSFSFA